MKRILIAFLIFFVFFLCPVAVEGAVWTQNVGLLPGSAVVFASDAPAIDRYVASAFKHLYGDRVGICDGTADIADINTAIAAGYRHIILSSGTFTDDTNTIDMTPVAGAIYSMANNKAVILEGQGVGHTRINFTASSGWVFDLVAEVACFHQIKNIAIQADSTTDGIFNMAGAYGCRFENLLLHASAGWIAHISLVTSGSYSNEWVNVNTETTGTTYGVKNGFNIDCSSSNYFTNCDLCGAELILFDIDSSNAYLWMNQCQLTSNTTVFDTVGGKIDLADVYIDSGSSTFTAFTKVETSGVCQTNKFVWDRTCDVSLGSSITAGMRYMVDAQFLNIPSEFYFFTIFSNRGWVGTLEGDNASNTVEADSTALSGYRCYNTVNNVAGLVSEQNFNYYSYIPAGKYDVYFRLKDTAGVASGVKVRIENIMAGTDILLEDLTVTTSYAWYKYSIDIPFTAFATGTESNRRLHMYVYKNGTTTDTVSHDCTYFVYTGLSGLP